MKKTLIALLVSGLYAGTVTAQDLVDIEEYISTNATAASTSTLLRAAAPTAAEKKARSYQGFLTQANVPYANQLGTMNGKGVLVGVADTGAAANHAELKGQIATSYNVFDKTSNVTDTVGHGTHVSGIIAGTLANGAMLQGVAPGAQLAVAKVFSATGTTSSTSLNAGINWLVTTAKAQIINLSLGGSSQFDTSAIRNGVQQGVLFTIAAGNEGKNTVSWPARYASQPWAANQIIVVGALDAQNKRASFSNYGADTAAWTVFAPGTAIASSYKDNNYYYMNGTSQAAPIVAGQAALIKSEWSFLTASQVAQIIFRTATRLGTATDAQPDPVYGWGLVNVAKSMNPIGTIEATAGVKNVNLGTASMVSPTGTVGTKSLKMMGTDEFGRGFSVDLAKGVSSTASIESNVDDMFSAMARREALADRVIGDSKVAFAFTRTYADNKVIPMALSYSQDLAKGMAMGFGAGAVSDKFFGLQSSGIAPLSMVEGGRFNAPYFGFVKGATHLGSQFALNGDTTLRFGAMTENPSFAFSNGQALDKAFLANRSLATTEVEKRFGRGVGILSFGVLQEKGSLLGSTASEALALAGSTKTMFAALSGGYSLSEQVALSAMASYGYSGAFSNANSLVSNVSGVSTLAYSIGLSAKEVFGHGDQLGLSFAMPTKVISGAMTLSGAVSQNADGSLNHSSQVMNLRPDATERNVELAYASTVSKTARLTSAVMLRMNPGHDASARNDVVMGVRYANRF